MFQVTPNKSRGRFLGMLRVAALIAALAGTVGSLGLTLHAGRHNSSRILVALFAVWVLSPFVALVWANVVSARWAVLTRATLYTVTLLLTLGALAIYGEVALGPPRPKPAFIFLVVPLASWLLIAGVIPLVTLLLGRLSRRAGRA